MRIFIFLEKFHEKSEDFFLVSSKPYIFYDPAYMTLVVEYGYLIRVDDFSDALIEWVVSSWKSDDILIWIFALHSLLSITRDDMSGEFFFFLYFRIIHRKRERSFW